MLLAIAGSNRLRELEAVARRWRGEALLAQGACGDALAELSRAAVLAEDIGRVRLQLDTHAALARLHGSQGEVELARRHDTKARTIAGAIENSLVSSGLDARLYRALPAS